MQRVVSFRVTETEHAALEARRKATGHDSIALMVRDVVLADLPAEQESTDSTTPEDRS